MKKGTIRSIIIRSFASIVAGALIAILGEILFIVPQVSTLGDWIGDVGEALLWPWEPTVDLLQNHGYGPGADESLGDWSMKVGFYGSLIVWTIISFVGLSLLAWLRRRLKKDD